MRPRNSPPGEGAKRLLPLRYIENGADDPVAQPAMRYHVGVHRNLDPLYTFPNPRLVKNLVRGLPLRTSALRTLGGFANVFAIDASSTSWPRRRGSMPLSFGCAISTDARGKACLRAVADGLYKTTKPENRGRGIGFSQYTNSKGLRSGRRRAIGWRRCRDQAAPRRSRRRCGPGRRPGRPRHAERGRFHPGGKLGAARTGHLRPRRGDQPRLGQLPDPALRQCTGDRNDPDGPPRRPVPRRREAVSGPAGAAIANAVHDATGLRLRRMPFTPDAIRVAAMG